MSKMLVRASLCGGHNLLPPKLELTNMPKYGEEQFSCPHTFRRPWTKQAVQCVSCIGIVMVELLNGEPTMYILCSPLLASSD